MKARLTFLSLCVSLFAKSQIEFVQNIPLAQAKEVASSKNSLILVDCYTDWCAPCKKMDKEVFSNNFMLQKINRKYIVTKINMETDEGIEVAMRYAVKSYPTYLIFNSSGKLIYTLSGAIEAEAFISKVNLVAEDSSIWHRGYSSSFQIELPEFYKKHFRDKGFQENADSINSYLKEQRTLTNEANWLVCKTFSRLLSADLSEKLYLQLDTLIAYFGKQDVLNTVVGYLDVKVSAAIYKNNKMDFIKWEEEMANVQAKLGMPGFEERQKCLKWAEFYGTNKRWDEYLVNAEAYRKNFGFDNDIVFCRQIASGCNDSAILIKAKDWLQSILKTDNSFYPAFSFFRILHKTGKQQESFKYLKKAIAEVHKLKSDDEKTYLLNNTYLTLINKKTDEGKLKFIDEQIIKKLYGSEASITSALLYMVFYRQQGMAESLLGHLQKTWTILASDVKLKGSLLQTLKYLEAELKGNDQAVNQINLWNSMLSK